MRTGSDGVLNELDEPGAVDQLDGVVGDELLGGERESPRGDEEPLVAAGVVDGAQELLELGRADDAAAVVLALDDREQAVAPDAEVGPLVAGPPDELDVVAERLEDLGDELLEPFGGERGELSELQV